VRCLGLRQCQTERARDEQIDDDGTPITGPAAGSPKRATRSGTPMKPALGNAATRAPKAASFNPTPWSGRRRRRKVRATAIAIMSIAETR
jgi:hypothetical protein